MKTTLFAAAVSVAVAANATEANKPLRLHYDRPAEFFEEALVIGNGNIGAILYGGIGQDRLSLNDITLWTGEPEKGVTTPDAYKTIPQIREALDRDDYRAADSLQRKVQGHYSENYQPLGALTISYDAGDGGSVSDYVRLLDISDAIAFRGFKRDGQGEGSVYFASAPDSVIVVGIKSERPLTATLRLDSQLPHEMNSDDSGEMRSTGHAAYLSLPGYTSFDEKLKYAPERGTRFCTIVKAVPADGSVVANHDGSLTLKDVKDAVVYITNVTSFNGFDRD
ncbi:MAG: glycoside hydrolase family 95 protein, partial [Duncaniella sp.]|nr:glycoside hydrolase family 95 protein [Duncaniella sp.]